MAALSPRFSVYSAGLEASAPYFMVFAPAYAISEEACSTLSLNKTAAVPDKRTVRSGDKQQRRSYGIKQPAGASQRFILTDKPSAKKW
jgi:hypothetical protein